MRIKNIDIPQSALDAGTAAMTDGFTAGRIQAAVSASLRSNPDFAYPAGMNERARDEVDMRVADRLIQNARKSGAIAFAKGRWTVKAK